MTTGHRSIAPTILLACALTIIPAVSATWENDAGTGADAGDTRATATRVAFSSSSGALWEEDVDFYDVLAATSSPMCAEVTLGGGAVGARLAVEGTYPRNASQMVSASGARLGIASTGVTAAVLTLWDVDAATQNNPYTFTLADVRPGGPDTGASSGDASNTRSGATATSPGCIKGTLQDSLDLADVYALSVPSGSAVTYSLATSSQGISLSLVDVNGVSVGPLLAEQGIASVPDLVAGTYYLTASRTSSAFGSVPYVTGVSIGPPDPNGCRPGC